MDAHEIAHARFQGKAHVDRVCAMRAHAVRMRVSADAM